MRISDWSSDVCSSDLLQRAGDPGAVRRFQPCRDCRVFPQQRVIGVVRRQFAHGLPDAGVDLRDWRNAVDQRAQVEARPADQYRQPARSEEHTSELQSLMRISYAVFCLKKKKENITTYTYEE